MRENSSFFDRSQTPTPLKEREKADYTDMPNLQSLDKHFERDSTPAQDTIFSQPGGHLTLACISRALSSVKEAKPDETQKVDNKVIFKVDPITIPAPIHHL